MHLDDLLASAPAPIRIAATEVAAARSADLVFVVLDDDLEVVRVMRAGAWVRR